MYGNSFMDYKKKLLVFITKYAPCDACYKEKPLKGWQLRNGSTYLNTKGQAECWYYL